MDPLLIFIILLLFAIAFVWACVRDEVLKDTIQGYDVPLYWDVEDVQELLPKFITKRRNTAEANTV